MEGEPDTENVVYIDEYPEIRKRLWLRRLNAQRHLGVVSIAHEECDVVDFPHDPYPDDPA